jgi:hypothetical protein
VAHAGETPGSNSEGECFRLWVRQRRRADNASDRVAPGDSTLQTNLVCLVGLVYLVYLVRLVCLVFWLNESHQMNKIDQTNQTDQITIFGCRLTSFYWKVFHEFFRKERGLEHPTYAG